MEPNVILQGYALLLLFGLPAVAVRDAGRQAELERAAEFRRVIYASVAISLLLIAAVTFGVGVWQEVPAASLGWRVAGTTEAIGWAAGVAVAGLGVAWGVSAAGRALGLREGGLAYLLMPRSAREKRAFLLLAGVGALCEEYVYRGFLLFVLAEWTGSVWLAVAVTAASFGLAHGYQRLLGVVRSAALGGLLAVPVVFTGSLFPAVVAHFWINAAIGLGGWRWMVPAGSEAES